MQIIARVHESRRRTDGTFPLPSVVDCIRFAITEAGETLDAQIRSESNTYIRNNGRNHDPRMEWGQCGYMIVSALRSDTTDGLQGHSQPQTKTQAYCETVRSLCVALEYESEGLHHEALLNLTCAVFAWVEFCIAMGWEPDALIDETCAAFEAKHAVKVVV